LPGFFYVLTDGLEFLKMASTGRSYKKHFIVASAFLTIWFVMDLVQFIDWGIQHIWPSPVVCK